LQHTQNEKLQSDIEKLQSDTEKLQSDNTNLWKLIRRKREENSWDATGLIFHEVTGDNTFGIEDTFCG